MPRRRRMKFTTSTKNMAHKAVTNPMNTQDSILLVSGITSQGTRTSGNQVPNGAHVFNIMVYVNSIVPEGSGSTNYNYIVMCLRDGQSVPADIDFSTIGLSKTKNQVLISEMTTLGTEDAGPLRRKFNVKIPKIYNRIREGDQIVLVWTAQSLATENFMGFRYKYYQ